MQLRKATRSKAKIRLGLSAVSGAGKTYSALLIASGIAAWDKICVIDTENGSADLYEHLGEYNVITLSAPYEPERYIQAIKAAEDAGMEVIVIDSVSHEWDGKGGCLEIQEKLGGKYQDWAKVTPRHQAFIDAILQSKCHVITTVRRKQDYAMVTDGNKTKVEKNGLKEVTREGFEYELTANLEINTNHLATASKDRTGLFANKPPFTPSASTGKMILDWCESGVSIEEAVDNAIKGLVNCHTQDDFTEHKAMQPEFVHSHPRFKQARIARWDEVNKKEPMSKEQLQQMSVDLDSAIAQLQLKKNADEIDAFAAAQPQWIQDHGRFQQAITERVTNGMQVRENATA